MTAGPTYDNAWSNIRQVNKEEGWDTCDCGNCGGAVNRIPGVAGLPAGVERWHCTSCMQRYNVTWAPNYLEFGSF